MAMQKKSPLVIVLSPRIQSMMETLMGVTDYAHRFGPWDIHPIELGDWRKRSWRWENWRADGLILAHEIPTDVASRICNARIPTVLLQVTPGMNTPTFPLARAPRCQYASEACGRMAARYLVGLGHENFAFVDYPNAQTYWSVEREAGFRLELQSIAPMATYHRYGQAKMTEAFNWLKERPRLIDWLQALPKPCAVFAANDRRALQVSEACRFGGLPVPDKIALLGVDDDHWLCNASTPTLSSIRFGLHEAGFAIAGILAKMMDGHQPGEKGIDDVVVFPVKVVARQSTDWFAVRDSKVALALQHIHNDFAQPDFSIARLARLTGLARRTLELRFKNVTGKTIHEELDHVRLSHIVSLARERKCTRQELLCGSGYHSLSAMDRAMKKSKT